MLIKSGGMVFLLLLLTTPLLADVSLPSIFGDHMVLQREAKVPFWGSAEPGEKVAVTAQAVTTTATAGSDGKWKVTLERLKASDTPIDVTISGKNTVVFHDVLVGDVWVCGGQSNMQFGLAGANNAAEEIAKANQPTIRLFNVHLKIAFDPQTQAPGLWQTCTPATAARFSAIGYFFGREVQQLQHVPVGLIHDNWGGTPAESWTSLEALKSNPLLLPVAKKFEDVKSNLPELKRTYQQETLPRWQQQQNAAWEKAGGTAYDAALQKWTIEAASLQTAGLPIPPKPLASSAQPKMPAAPDADTGLPTGLFNGMIAPIIPYAIKGVIWYQGESNAGASKLYQTLFPALITDWRKRWGEGDFPFLWAQICNSMTAVTTSVQTSIGFPGIREAQSMTLKLPNTAQAVIIDIGDANNVHPKNKLDVAHRLVLAARHVAYGEDIIFSGPTFDSIKVESETVRITFKNVGSGLTIAAAPSTQPGVPQAKPADELEGFSIAGSDRKFVWAKAMIDGDSVIVSSVDVPHPQAVRYAWANNPKANLYNREGLPASPFRTDDW